MSVAEDRRAQIPPEDRLIGSQDLAAWLRIHIVTLYKLLKFDPNFPKPIRLRPKGNLYWRESVIREYSPPARRSARRELGIRKTNPRRAVS